MFLMLIVTEGPHRGESLTFDRHDTFLVGRSPEAPFVLPEKDPYFSRLHFLVEVNPPLCRLIDMKSRNGTAVNGRRVTVADMRDGDVIQAGHTAFRVTLQQPPSAGMAGTLDLPAGDPAALREPAVPRTDAAAVDPFQTTPPANDFPATAIRAYQDSPLSGLTVTGAVGGTPAFMPPEQVTDFRNVRPAADQYATAATLYQMLTARPLYDGVQTLPDLLGKLFQEDPVSLLRRRPQLPPALAEAVHRGLARKPEGRYPDAIRFRAALLPFADG